MTIKKLNTKALRIDGDTQSRVEIDLEVVQDYAAALAAGIEFPPVTVFFDGADHWLADGFHRWHAHNTAGKASIQAEVRNGTQRDAIYFSLHANVSHGLRPSNADKRKSVERMLADAEWSQLSDREIAKHCGCSHPLVGQIRNPRPAAEVKKPAAAKDHADSGAGNITTRPALQIPAAAAPTEREQQAQQAAEDAHGDFDPIKELEAQQREIEELQKQLKVATADDTAAEAAKYQRIAAVNEQRKNELQATVNERDKELTKLMGIIRRCGKAVGEENPYRVAASVEAFVRKAQKVVA